MNKQFEGEDVVVNSSPTSRGNFSKCGKILDQNFYPDSSHSVMISTKKVEVSYLHKVSPQKSTSSFSSVSRQKRGNFRVSIPDANGEFTTKPNHMYVRNKSPKWSFPKQQRYEVERVKGYQLCQRHPIIRSTIQRQRQQRSNSMMKDGMKNSSCLNKSVSEIQTNDNSKNYSSILPRRGSNKDFLSQTKIKNSHYLSREQINNEQQSLEICKNSIGGSPKGYLQFFKRRPRQPIKKTKGFETFVESYNHEKQFNNFELTKYPVKPMFHIDFDKCLERDTSPRLTYGPTLQYINISAARVSHSNANLDTSKFIEKIRIRNDYGQLGASTRVSYDIAQPQIKKIMSMEKVIPRKKILYPIVDPSLKKRGDYEVRLSLRERIVSKQINEALSPKARVI